MTDLAALPRYKGYKDSGVEWFGKVPEHWDIIPLRYLAKIQTGNTPSKNIESFYTKTNGIPWIKPDELDEFQELIDSNEMLTPRGAKEARIIQKGSVLVCCIGTIGKIGLAGCELATNQQINSVTFSNQLLGKFAAYLVYSSSKEHERKANGNVVRILNTNSQKSILFPIPPKHEQKEIIAYLNTKTTQIDQAITIKQKQIELLKERRQILIQNAVTRGLDPQVPMRDSGVAWIGEIPAHWEVRRSKFLFTQRTERASPSDQQLSATQAYGVILQEEYERMVGRKMTKLMFHLEKRRRVEIDDFVISMRSFQGGLERAWASGGIRSSYVVLKPLQKIDPDFYAYLFKIPRYIEALQATGNFIRDGQDLNFENFSKVDLFIPPLDEQKSIAAHIKVQAVKIDQAITLQQQQIDRLKEYRATLINSAVTGKIKVPEVV